jgi:hypothetical protein
LGATVRLDQLWVPLASVGFGRVRGATAERRAAGFRALVVVLRGVVAGFAVDDAGLAFDSAGFAVDAAGLAFDAADALVDVAGFRVPAGFLAAGDGFGFEAAAAFRVAVGGFVAAAVDPAVFVDAFAGADLAEAGRFGAGRRRVAAGLRAAAGFDVVDAAVPDVRAPRPLSGPPIGTTLTGETASTACAAAAPTSLAAPLTRSPTVSAALPAADAARLAILPAIAATSRAASAARFVLFETCFRPLVPWAAASWATRFASVFLAPASRFSSFWSSLNARLDTGFTASLAPSTRWVMASTRASLALPPFPDPALALGIQSLQFQAR